MSSVEQANAAPEGAARVVTNCAYFIPQAKESIRVLAVMPEDDIALTIKLHCRSARIRQQSLSRLNTMLQYRRLVPVAEQPFLINEAALTEKQKAHFKCIQPALLELTKDGVLSLAETTLWTRIKEVAARVRKSPDAINAALTRVMQSGGVLFAAVARWKHVPAKELPSREGTYALSEADKVQIGKGVREFLVGGATWEEAWDEFLKKYYPKEVVEKNGERVVIVRDAGDRPSKDQFIYHGMKRVSLVDRLILRYGEEAYQRNHRGRPNGHSHDARYPGVRVDVDWTLTDIVCVTRNGRLSVGRLVLFMVIDRFSGMIMSAYLTMSTACYKEAGRAILGCLEDKAELFKKYNLALGAGEWDVSSLPVEITVDKGELSKWRATPIVTALGIHIEVAPTRRADLKGTVESMFEVVRRFLRRRPGATSGVKERQTEHPNVTAVYDFDEVYALVLTLVAKSNARIRRRQAMTPGMVRNKVLPIPNKIWAYGKQLGCLRQFSIEEARVGILPACFASVTEAGIKVMGLHYTVPDFDVDAPGGIEANEWLTQARIKRWKVEVGIDEAAVDYVWLRHRPPGLQPVVLQCPLNGEHDGHKGLSWTEYLLQKRETSDSLKEYRERELMDIKGLARSRVERITSAAQRATAVAREGLTNQQIKTGAPDQRPAEAATTTQDDPDLKPPASDEFTAAFNPEIWEKLN